MVEFETPLVPVQDTLDQNVENLPEMFTRKAVDNPLLGAEGDALPWRDCPVINFSLLSSHSELAKLHSALLSWGCFQLINHDISDSLLDEIREVCKKFFVLPKEERMVYLKPPNDPEGYGNDVVTSKNVPHNWNDRLYLNVFPEDQRKLNLWPQTPTAFRGILDEFSLKVKVTNEKIVQAMARSLKLEENCLIDKYGERKIAARINFYPQCPFPDLVHASRAHSDASAMTFLLQDKKVEGLQVLNEDKWFKVPIIPNALFVNVGDQMEIMSNGIFKSPVHRVVANSERERISIAMFCSPDPNAEIGPLKELVNKDQQPLYKTISRYSEIFFRYHPNGLRPIEATKLDCNDIKINKLVRSP